MTKQHTRDDAGPSTRCLTPLPASQPRLQPQTANRQNKMSIPGIVAAMVAVESLTILTALVFFTSCSRSNSLETAQTIEPIQGQSVRLTVPGAYTVKEVWSPDSLVAKFVRSDSQVEVYVEVGESGYPDYSQMPEYQSEPIEMEGYKGEVISFMDTRQAKWRYTAILRFPDFNWVRSWSHAQDVNALAEARQIMKTLKWSQ